MNTHDAPRGPRRARAWAPAIAAVTSAVAGLALVAAAPAWAALPQNDDNPAPPARSKPPPKPAKERTIEIFVLEVAGGKAYIRPGEEAGVRPGQEVRIGKQRFRVISVTRDSAIIELGDKAVSEGDPGRARVRVRNPDEPVLPAPTPLSDFEGQWTPPTLPASQQNPKLVALGSGADLGAYQVVLRAGVASILSGDQPFARMTVGASMHAEPWREVPFGIDADLAVSLWLGEGLDSGLGADSRPVVSVRELQLRYGDRYRPYIGLGRLRYAATTLGLLDGVRLTTPRFNGAQVAVFGGAVPDALDGAPDFDHRRFGMEATFDNPELPWQPFLTVVAHGSLFDGELDERRLSSYASARQGPMTVGAHAELSFFDEDNPWGVSPAELTAAGVDGSLRWGNHRVGARVDMRQPERSLWLASLLPPSWLCTTTPQPPPDPADPNPLPEPCSDTRDLRYSAALDAQTELGSVLLSGGASAIGVSNGEDPETFSVFADARVVELFGTYRAHLGAFHSQSTLLDTTAVRLGGGGPMPFLRSLDLSLYYRPAVIRYNAALENFLDHRVGIDGLYSPLPRLDIAVTVEAMVGADVGAALGTFATAVWRPQL
ncbi:MAG: hypothetical protein Tsb0020_03720 [Haliangiales bacterium]